MGHTRVIGFSKRGLPYTQFLLDVVTEDKPTTPQRIDEAISAEIPDPVKDPQLYALVERYMVHGPCGAPNPECLCATDGSCTKYYPKPWVPETLGCERVPPI